MSLALLRLLQLASPTLPVGAYTYSQALESAVDARLVVDEATTADWLGDSLVIGIGRWEAPLVATQVRAWAAGEDDNVAKLDAGFVASRETAELRAETLQMGFSLARLLMQLPAFVAITGYRERLAAV
ncbi:MAG TPA: urease accessory UreF family protein, partial [Casimicrobiaceae bacterium]|nr:urease accessory UreF family protein [Casimicrobiaceae bacterium]